jgi:transposase
MDREERRRRVQEMLLNGCEAETIACKLGIPLRTVYRDRDAIRRENAGRLRPQTADEIVQSLSRKAQRAADRIRRLANMKDCPLRVRIRAEYKSWEVHLSMAKLLQSLGYLPDVTRGRAR